MPWADVLQIVASGVSIVDCSYRLAKFIKHLNDDVREIHEWLTEMKTRIDTLHEVLNWVETIARDPNMKNIDDLPINIIHDIVQGSKSQVAKILGKLPQPPDNGVVPKLEAVLKKLMEDRAIKEHVSALQQWTSLLQAMIGGLTL